METIEIIEPKHHLSIIKWNVVGYNNLLKHDLILDGNHKVKIIIGKSFVSILQINSKHPKIVNNETRNEVREALKTIYDDLNVVFTK